MKFFVQILFFISITFLSYGQYEKGRYKVDSLQIFSGDKLTYEFNLHGSSQGLFFDRYVYSQLPYIQLKIYNNTEDTITTRYREKDAHLMWIRAGAKGSCETMAPNDYFILRSGWAGWGNRPVGPFRNLIQIQTQNGDSVANSTIYTWGEIYPEKYNFNYDTVESKHVKSPEDSALKGPLFPGANSETQSNQMLTDYIDSCFNKEIFPKKDIGKIVYFEFTIDRNGEVVEPKVLKSVSPSIDKEIIRILSLMPNWTPGNCILSIDPQEDANYPTNLFRKTKCKMTSAYKIE